MISGISGLSAYYNSYSYQPTNSAGRASRNQPVQQTSGVWTAQKAANPETPVEPVRPVTPVSSSDSQPTGLGLPLREGVDPAEMAVRMRIQYVDGAQTGQGTEGKNAQGAAGEDAQGVEGVLNAVEEGKCETCEQRKYQDGSDDMGVSFQTPTRIDPDLVPSAVRGHEMEHVVREQAKAQREDRRVVSQSVSLHTDICPECGKVYISGGTTRTVTAANPEPVQETQAQERVPFSAVA